jgi:hypothetical protein
LDRASPHSENERNIDRRLVNDRSARATSATSLDCRRMPDSFRGGAGDFVENGLMQIKDF